MIQLLLILISILYGFLYSLSTKKINNLIIYTIITIIYIIAYIFIIYQLYNGKISPILKISLITGYIMCQIITKNVKKHKKTTINNIKMI